MPDVMERIIIFPGVSAAEYLGLQAMADALLDTPHFGGGTSSLDAMATGAPFITWPGQFMRGRISAACYQLMGLSELVAADGEAYVDLALRAGTDRAWREEVRARIIEHSARLYENRTVVREMESFFACAVEAAGKGERITWRANTAVKS
jgi:predicted O-linked N-acetylglucosamine transferase (SPINDLY family)